MHIPEGLKCSGVLNTHVSDSQKFHQRGALRGSQELCKTLRNSVTTYLSVCMCVCVRVVCLLAFIEKEFI